MQDDREDRIRQRAHEIWEREGQPEGKHDEHWAQATAEIAAEDDGKGSGTASKGKAGKAATAKRAGKAEAGKVETAKTAVGGTGSGSTRAAAENLSAVAGSRSEKAGGKTRTPRTTKKNATG